MTTLMINLLYTEAIPDIHIGLNGSCTLTTKA